MQTDEEMIYAAGNPDNYPLEYYDSGSGEFCGVIPTFLEEFSEEYGYEIKYLQPGADDNREHFAQNEQVDIISGCTGDEKYENVSGAPLVLFRFEESGEEKECVLFLTGTAPERLREDLKGYASDQAASRWTGEVIASAGSGAERQMTYGTPTGVWAAVGCLAVLIIILLGICYKNRKNRLRESFIDAETGLKTQNAAKQAYYRILKDQSRRFYYMIYFQLDLDNIGYMYGAEIAGKMLEHGVNVLKREEDSSEIVSRTYDRGILVLRRFVSDDEAEAWTGGIISELKRFMYGSKDFDMYGVSAGVFPVKNEYRDFDQALFHLRQCAFVSRDEKTGVRVSGPEKCRRCIERWKLFHDFENGIKRGEFEMYIQFFIEAKTLKIVGGEALSRWEHPQMGFLSPSRYISLLEADGRIGSLDLYILEKTCAFLEELDKNGIKDFFISCNFARKTFAAADFTGKCIDVIEKYSFERRMLALEVTESQLIDSKEAENMLKNIVEIRNYGVRVIFDDFGMGFSSYHDLQEYPMDGLKLDKELIDCMDSEQGRIIVSALVDTGHRMGYTILAEGVEKDYQIEILTKLDCDIFQGFRFYVPLPEEEARRRILEKRS